MRENIENGEITMSRDEWLMFNDRREGRPEEELNIFRRYEKRIMSLLTDLHRARKQIAARDILLLTVPGWTSVEEPPAELQTEEGRKLGISVRVILLLSEETGGEVIGRFHFKDGVAFYQDPYMGTKFDVTHWRPLPKPPEQCDCQKGEG